MRQTPKGRTLEPDGDIVLPAPLEVQLETLVEEVLGDAPVTETLPMLVSDRQDDRRIVVTGIGVVSPVGNTLDAFWASISTGRSGIGYNDAVPNYREYPCHSAGVIRDFDPRSYIDFKEARRMSRAAQFGVAAGRMALEDSGLTVGPHNADEIGVVMGSGTTALPETDQ